MAHIYIEPVKAKRFAQDEADLARTLSSLSQEVLNIRRNMRYKISGQERISERLRQVSEQIARESNAAKALSSGLGQAVALYERTEAANCDSLIADKTAIQPSGLVTGKNAGGWDPFDWGNLGKTILKSILGPFGIAVSIPGLAGGKGSDLTKFLLDGVGSFAKVASAKGDTSAEWLKDLFGLNPMEFTSFKDTFLGKLGKFDTTAHTVGTVANWAVKLVDSFVKNSEEFAGNWCARFWEETIVEAGIKLVEGAAVTAGVSAITAGVCAAVGAACPPVLVVGVIAAGAGLVLDWGLNGLVSWATGGSCTSWVEGLSDIVCDGVDVIRENIGNVVSKAGETISNVKDGIVKTGKKVVNSIGNGIKNAVDGLGNLFSGRWAGCLFA